MDSGKIHHDSAAFTGPPPQPPAYPGPPPPGLAPPPPLGMMGPSGMPPPGMMAQPKHVTGVAVMPGATVVSVTPGVAVVPGHTTVIGPAVVPGTLVVSPAMGRNPTTYVCPSCNLQIVTRVERNSTLRTHLFALLLCIFGCWPCVCIPYCVDSCKNAEHYCPNCGAYIGVYQN